MTTFALVGAGPGLGLAAARRFGAAGHRVALLSRSADHLEPLVAELSRDGTEARAYPADVLAPDTLTAALGRAAEELGPVEILQYSPVPRADFMKPVLETTAADLDDPLAFSVKAPVTCVQAVLPGMRALGRGTLLFVNGGSAVRPAPDALAERLYALHTGRDEFRHYAEPLPG
ncbi:SDR family NAD(P)-dependent oxidoreductase [Streptomyces albidoflavus]